MATGVHKTKSGTFAARICRLSGFIYVGTFNTEQLAIDAREKIAATLEPISRRVLRGSVKLSNHDMHRIAEFRKKKMTFDQIAPIFNVNRETIRRNYKLLCINEDVMK